jgi:hypothetical protein
MRLAKDLLEKGERQIVLDYFALCRKFWNYGRLDEWSQQVKGGEDSGLRGKFGLLTDR